MSALYFSIVLYQCVALHLYGWMSVCLRLNLYVYLCMFVYVCISVVVSARLCLCVEMCVHFNCVCASTSMLASVFMCMCLCMSELCVFVLSVPMGVLAYMCLVVNVILR